MCVHLNKLYNVTTLGRVLDWVALVLVSLLEYVELLDMVLQMLGLEDINLITWQWNGLIWLWYQLRLNKEILTIPDFSKWIIYYQLFVGNIPWCWFLRILLLLENIQGCI